jgi:cytochrome c oxidase cbb3-type subunit 2
VLGHPYTDEEVAGAKAELASRSEQDALIAYLQVLGTSFKSLTGAAPHGDRIK